MASLYNMVIFPRVDRVHTQLRDYALLIKTFKFQNSTKSWVTNLFILLLFINLCSCFLFWFLQSTTVFLTGQFFCCSYLCLRAWIFNLMIKKNTIKLISITMITMGIGMNFWLGGLAHLVVFHLFLCINLTNGKIWIWRGKGDSNNN